MTRFFTTIPPSSAFGSDYATHVTRVATWSEAAGAEGALIYTDNTLSDPWSVAQLVLERTRQLVPLIATQPIYMPPFMAAKRITSFGQLYGRKVALNMVAGGFVRDLNAFGDCTPHDARYARLEEYSQIVQALLGDEVVSIRGAYYTLEGVRLQPALHASLRPDFFLSGSSDAGRETAAALGASPVVYPPPPDEIAGPFPQGSFARIGIIARTTSEEAWTIAHARFPKDKRGRMAHKLAAATSDSVWLGQLTELGARLESQPQSIYWLHPLQQYQTFCPYIVGSHAEVARVLEQYDALGFHGFIMDVPATQEDLPNTLTAMALAGLSLPSPYTHDSSKGSVHA
ncbi:MAG: LLM class flavin-dependent oxidoreductase [Natronohydrobacter sp.]|nr:LLM class flavin-dependent oxidoreductase [Natronohydrobacter sp.]